MMVWGGGGGGGTKVVGTALGTGPDIPLPHLSPRKERREGRGGEEEKSCFITLG